MKRKKIFITILIFALLIPVLGYGEGNQKKVVIFFIDSISIKDIRDLDLDNYGIGLMNNKTREPYGRENFYTSLNLGRKVSEKTLEKEGKLSYLGDILKKENPIYIGEDDSLKYFLEDKDGIARGNSNMEYSYSWLDRNIDSYLKESNLLAIEYNILDDETRLETLVKLLNKNKDRGNLIYLVPREVSSEDKNYINNYLLPVIKISGKRGVLTSQSTRRKGLLAIEDISVDIKENFNVPVNNEIGRTIRLIEDESNLDFIANLERRTINLLYLASLGHGLVYLAQAILLLGVLKPRFKDISIYFLIFAMNNIWITFILSVFKFQDNILFYILTLFAINIFISRKMLEDRKILNTSIVFTYLAIIISVLFMPEVLYNSYMGFNNLIYGARFYGMNNGIAAVLLATSLIIIMFINRWLNDGWLKNILIGIIPILNLVVLSTGFGANTGSFISGILLLTLVYYNYYFLEKVNYKLILLFIACGIGIFALNIYFDSLSFTRSHAVQFFARIYNNGLREIYPMVAFKLRELIKLTLMPPFSLVIICQLLILINQYSSIDRGLKIIIITSILGFLINDTGNILLIYMLSYVNLMLSEKRWNS